MTKQQIISETIGIIEKLPKEKAVEIRNILVNYYNSKDNEIFEKGFEMLVCESGSYEFLKNEPDIYDEKDLIERYV